jgi:hypothetical protein
MLRDDLRTGVPAGLLAATATGGALIAVGHRTATASRPFNVIAMHLLGTRGNMLGFVAAVTLTGLLLHVVITTASGIVAASIANRRLAPSWVIACGISLLMALVSVGVARRGGASLAAIFTVGDLVVFYLTMALALMVGMRIAFFDTADRETHADFM